MSITEELFEKIFSVDNPDNNRMGANFPVYKFHRLYEPRATLTDDEKQTLLHVENESRTGFYVLNPFFVSILRDHRIWFAPASHFNDPWDAGAAVSIVRSSKPIEESVLRQFFSEDEQPALAELGHEEIYTRIEARMAEVFSSLRFACFTRRLDCNPMWAHYADNHRGVCLEFRFMRQQKEGGFTMDPPFTGHYDVRYDTSFAQLGALENIGAAIQVLQTKHPDWAYEKELRFIKRGDGAHPGVGGTVSFYKSSLTKVILGCKVPPAVWRAVEILLDHCEYKDTGLVRAVFNGRTQSLEFLVRQRVVGQQTTST